MDLTKIDNVVIAGVDTKDYPDFCDAYVESADYDGEPMDEEELDRLQEEHPEFVHECLMNQLL